MLIVSQNRKPKLVILKLLILIKITMWLIMMRIKLILFGIISGMYTQESVGEFKELPARFPALPCYDVSFSREAVLNKLNNLKVNKSPGPDTLHPRILLSLIHISEPTRPY